MQAIAGPPAKHVERAIKVTSPIPFKFRSDSRIKGVATAEEVSKSPFIGDVSPNRTCTTRSLLLWKGGETSAVLLLLLFY